LLRKAVEVSENETRESLEKKIHVVEHELYPTVLQDIFGTQRRRKMNKRALISVSDKVTLLSLLKNCMSWALKFFLPEVQRKHLKAKEFLLLA